MSGPPPGDLTRGAAGEVLTLQDQRRLLRKSHLVDASSVPFVVRPLLPVADLIRMGLIRLNLDSRVVTFAWFVIALVAYGLTMTGELPLIAIGCVLVYLKFALDLVDGELGRYQGQSMSDRENARSHMKGIYLDRIQHAMESPLWGLSLGVGAYHMTGSALMLACGGVLAAYRSFCRIDPMLKASVRMQFADRLDESRGDEAPDPRDSKTGAGIGRIYAATGTVELWIRNGKRFNTLILIAAGIDAVLTNLSGVQGALPAVIVVSAITAAVSVTVQICAAQFGSELG